MNSIIEKRKKVYEDLPKINQKENSSGIVLFYNIDENQYLNLQNAVKEYLIEALTLTYNRSFVWSDTFLEDNNDLIMGLPNKTPNGIIKPKIKKRSQFRIKSENLNNLYFESEIVKLD